MTRRLKIIIALVAGLMAAIIAIGWLQSREAALISAAAPVRIVVASRNMPPGHVVTADDIVLQEIPQRFVQPGTFTDPTEVTNQLVIAGILQAEQITASKIVFERAEPLAAKLRSGHRGVTLAVNPVTSVGGLVEPGDLVDVIGIFELGESADDVTTEARYLLQNVLVLATGTYSGGGELQEESQAGAPGQASPLRSYANVTLALSPEDTQALVLAQTVSTGLYLVLRSVRETEEELTLEVLTPQLMLGTDRPIWSEALQEAEFQRQLLNRR